jgi:hypothetical protein
MATAVAQGAQTLKSRSLRRWNNAATIMRCGNLLRDGLTVFLLDDARCSDLAVQASNFSDIRRAACTSNAAIGIGGERCATWIHLGFGMTPNFLVSIGTPMPHVDPVPCSRFSRCILGSARIARRVARRPPNGAISF